MMADKKTYTMDEIVNLLETRVAAVERAMVRLYDLQRLDEKQVSESKWLNLEGFCAFSARSGSKFARAVISRERKGVPAGQRLYGSWLTRARQIAIRHRKQLLAVANA